jgi:hypothetical protein
MTTIVLNYSQSLFNGLWRVLRNTFKGMILGYMLARQTQANYRIARLLICEYRGAGHTVESLHHKLNMETLDRLRKEYGNV